MMMKTSKKVNKIELQLASENKKKRKRIICSFTAFVLKMAPF